jgi:hypothetical protein
MTYGEALRQAPLEERVVYVYMWLYKTENGDMPFYVGLGTNNRYKSRSSRSKAFKEFLSKHECYPIRCSINLTYEFARELERKLKSELQARGITILDAEDCESEYRKRRAEGIAAMPTVNGKKVSLKTGRATGRPTVELDDDFEKFLEKQKRGEISVKECCNHLKISRSTWYNRVSEVG